MLLNFMQKEYAYKLLDKLDGDIYNSQVLNVLCDDVNVLVGDDISSSGINFSLKFIMRTLKGNLILTNAKGETLFNNKVMVASASTLNDYVLFSSMNFVKGVFLEGSSPIKMATKTHLTPFGIIKKEDELEMVIQIIFDDTDGNLHLKEEYSFKEIQLSNLEPLVKKSIKYTKD